ncbi:MAG: hypothetical protein ACE141_15640 [Bryobacteraceae bacterium]
MSQSRGQQQRYSLELEAQAELGNIGPELAWPQVEVMVAQCMEVYYQEAEDLRLRNNLPVDLRNPQELLGASAQCGG